MAEKMIRIRVGAAADSSLTTVFASLREMAGRAAKVVKSDMTDSAKSMAVGYRDNARVAEKEIGDVATSAKKAASTISGSVLGAAKNFADLASSAKQLTPTLQTVAREAQRELQKIEKAGARAALGLDLKPKRSLVDMGLAPNAKAAMGYGRTAINYGAQVVGGIIRGSGIDLDVGSQTSKASSLQSTIVGLSNSGYMPGAAGANGQRQNVGDLTKDVTKTANETGFAVNQAAEGLSAFVAKTGDLETGRKIFKDLAVLSKATKTNLDDMVDAAGDVANNLGDIPNKSQRTVEVMRAIAGQGKLGAVEIKDLASQMAKIAAVAPQFEGDAGKNMALMGAFAQEARQRGGAASATQAATSVMSFTNTFAKGARYDAFKALGIDVYSKTEKGKIRDPRAIVTEALQKTHGDPLEMNKLFKDVQAQKAVKGFSTIYNDAYGAAGGSDADKTAAATKAVSDEFDRLTNVAMGSGEIMTSFNAAMSTAESKTNIMNNNLETSAAKLQDALLPAIVALTPAMVQFAGQLGSIGIAVAGFLKSMGIGDTEQDDEAKRTDTTAKTAKDLIDKTKNGTVTQADIDGANQQRADLQHAIKGKQEELQHAKDVDATNTHAEDSMLGRFLVSHDPTGILQNTVDRRNGGVSMREQQLSSLENQDVNLKNRVAKAEDVVKVHIVADSTPKPLARPTNPPHPVNSK